MTVYFYVQLEVKITHSHRLLPVRQANWRDPFIDISTHVKGATMTAFDENFYNLTVKSALVKTMESKRNQKKLSIFCDKKRSNAEFLPDLTMIFQINGERVATVTSKPNSTRQDKQTKVGK